MNEPTMMETANPTSGTPTSSDTVQTTAATAEVLYGDTHKSTSSQEPQAAKAVEAAKPDATKDNAVKAAGAPETYEFKPPEGRQFDNEVVAKFSEVARELDLTNEEAQMILDKMGTTLSARQEANLKSIRDKWAEASTSDKEFGGEKLPQNLAVAKKALDAFGTEELRTLLNESGLGNHPEVIRFMVRAGKSISEDTIVTGAAPTSRSRGPFTFNDAATVLYSNQSNT
jgi:hypothetical protein